MFKQVLKSTLLLFFTGSVIFSIFSASTVSARMLPITNAPKALLNPALVETTAIRQHKPSDTMSKVSDVIILRVFRKKSGIANIPTTNHRIRKNMILNSDMAIC